jgi:hypothetical protein
MPHFSRVFLVYHLANTASIYFVCYLLLLLFALNGIYLNKVTTGELQLKRIEGNEKVFVCSYICIFTIEQVSLKELHSSHLQMDILLIVSVLIGFIYVESSTISQTTQTFDFCRAYEQDCITLMNAVNCSASKIQSSSCTDKTLQTFNGTCACGGFDIGSGRLIEDVIDSQIKSRISNLLVYTALGSVDICASYTSICMTFFSAINCPATWQTFIGCAANLPTDLFNSNTSCVCGSMDVASDRIKELMVDNMIATHSSTSSTQANVSRNEMCLFLLLVCLLSHVYI